MVRVITTVIKGTEERWINFLKSIEICARKKIVLYYPSLFSL